MPLSTKMSPNNAAAHPATGARRLLGRKKDEGYSQSETRLAFLFLSPSVVLLLLLVAIPMAFAFYLSLNEVSIVAGSLEYDFVGLGNYAQMLVDPRFMPTLLRTLEFTVLRVGGAFLVGLAVALLLNESSLAASLLKILFLIPWALSFVLNALMWRWMFNADYGVINDILLRLGLISSSQSWLGDPGTALYALTLADAWKAIPFVALVLLAGLQNIPEERYEAAKVDGAAVLQRFRYITLPALQPVILVALVLQTMWSVKVFATIWVATKGGPMDSTMLLNIYAYQHSFMFINLGYGAALAYVVTAIILILTVCYMAFVRLEEI